MKYEVVRYFTDLQDNDYAYNVGDTFPRDGLEVSEERINELTSKDNKQGVVLIKPVEEKQAEAAPEAKAEPEAEKKPKPRKKVAKKETE